MFSNFLTVFVTINNIYYFKESLILMAKPSTIYFVSANSNIIINFRKSLIDFINTVKSKGGKKQKKRKSF